MTPEDLTAALEAMRWNPTDLARELGVSVTLAKRWCGKSEPAAAIPAAVASFVRARRRAIEKIRPPIPHHAPPPAPIQWRPAGRSQPKG